MNLIGYLILLIVFKERSNANEIHAQLGKNVWEVGKDDAQSVVIDSKEGNIKSTSKGLDYNITVPLCHQVVYVRLEVDNQASTPDVELNYKNVNIKYKKDQASESTYKLLVKGNKTCSPLRNKRYSSNYVSVFKDLTSKLKDIQKYGRKHGEKNKIKTNKESSTSEESDEYIESGESKEPQESEEDSEEDLSEDDNSSDSEYDTSGETVEPGMHVWTFGTQSYAKLLAIKETGYIRNGLPGFTLKFLGSFDLPREVFIKVTVWNDEAKPTVALDYNMVQINYSKGQMKKSGSKYEILVQGIYIKPLIRG